MAMLKKIFLTGMILIAVNDLSSAQSFGFGCLGLVGGYGGYSYQQYQPGMLGTYINQFNTSLSSSDEQTIDNFGKADGYRVGLNFFRAKFSWFFLTAKGYYQSLNESHDGRRISSGNLFHYDYDLKLNSWGVGLDVGIPIFNGLHWKILDGTLLINSARLTETVNSAVEGTSIRKFNNEKTELSFSIGSGLIVEILKDYISLEGILGYSNFNINKMTTDDNIQFKDLFLSSDDNEPFIKSGGFNAVIQLNVGFPL
jgi:hypothetical protein